MSLILLVEDEEAQRAIAALTLQKAGHSLVEAAHGEQGLALARERKPDLIVCDVIMPGMNGYQLVTALRQDPAIADIPVILLTALSERAQIRTGMTAGADDYLPKPFRPAELVEAVSALLAKRQAQRQRAISSIQQKLATVLEDQKQMLAMQYERRLAQELNARWTQEEQANNEIAYERAVLLAVDIFGPVLGQTPGDELAAAVRNAFRSAQDTLYLFGATHVLPYGNELLAVFACDDSNDAAVRLRALRAAFALRKAAATGGLGVALHQGPVTLVRFSDALHGDAETILATGDSVRVTAGLRAFATASQWGVACSEDLLAGLGATLTTDRKAPLEPVPLARLMAVELTHLA